ncbi:hypothetical protein [Flectobacillus rivi]|uniref:Cytochrome c7-like domain-containing protein n=1 Tax=Flectobacillus rivi TaxID=2984209 RepID=A0ABT6Z737_9BACT|nr:hypothetical protein [Flectobacillus rivi]MDI9876414.1 hypothetical protein [Flectobacillus rivi]
MFGRLAVLAQSPHGKNFTMDCAKCHNSGGWKFDAKKSKFNHSTTGFALSGQHQAINCKACHTTLTFKKASSNCASCHTDRHNQTVGNNCARCHSTQSWLVGNITKLHEQTSFPLTGVHATIDCKKCHTSETSLQFKPTGLACVDCHRKDFRQTTNPNHTKLNLSTECNMCHNTMTSWKNALFPDHNSIYPLTGAHAAIAKDCQKCHIGGNFNNTPKDCAGCHKADFSKTSNPNHTKLNFSNDCASCHTTKPTWKPASFVTHNSIFALTGAHASIANNCYDCHKGGNFNNTPNDCNGCHSADFKKTSNPNHQTLGFSTDCASCHTTNPSWLPARFVQHDNFYPLTGGHKNIRCNECHKNAVYTNTPKDCNSCHNTNYNSSVNPSHKTMNLSTDCASCHTTAVGWRPTNFNHSTYYPLTGAHASIQTNCVACHKGDVKNTPKDCNGCHNTNYKSTSNPNHNTLNLSTDCASCHTTKSGWKPTSFNHSTFYPLTGAHAAIANNCASCHKGDVKNTPKDCNGCHNANYNTTTSPNHKTAGFSTDCASCHTTNAGWTPASFKAHDAFYPLTGAHATISCKDCHKNGNYTNTPKDCNSCHNAKYIAAVNPNHVSMNLSKDCASCHTTKLGWRPSSFNHNTVYPLTGAHSTIANNCTACHKSDVKNTPKDCNGCHSANYQTSANPNHTTLNLSRDCASCHTTNAGWRPTSFNHAVYYPLTGAHASVANNCTACHKGDVKNTPKDCNGCHSANYQTSANPNHTTLNLSRDCASCHTTNAGWRPTSFNHAVYYPLTGAHSTIANNCTACHKGDLKNTPKDCNGCHSANYQTSSNPNHIILNLSRDCASCHTTNAGWRPTSFNHAVYYPLTGAHAGVANNCTACHKGDVKNTPKDCNGCHSANYQTSANPNHTTLNLSRDCASCHTTNAGWRPTSFNHAVYYPLTGAHASVANNCTACHKSDVKNTPKDCNGCHNTAYNNATNPNHKAAGISTDCASCHSTNPGWRPSTFNHNVYYPLTGAHANIASNCASCHPNGRFKNTPTDCNSCHSGAYNSSASPNHSAINLSRDCASCHSTNPSWRPSTFNHNSKYPLVGAHAALASNCTACHAGGNYSHNGCYSCHASAYNRATPSHTASQFPTTCTDCHGQNAWKPANWNHDASYFPIYSGKHKGKWNTCTDCHTSPTNYSIFNCLNCHKKTDADKDHRQVRGYSYDNNSCYACHPRGSS